MKRLIDPTHATACFLAFATLSSAPGWAADLEERIRLLAFANLALMYGNVCEAEEPGFISRITGKDGDVRSYAQTVKDRAGAGLDRETALSVLKSAGDIAKRRALVEIRGLQEPGAEPDDRILRAWCSTTAQQAIRQFINLKDDPASEFSRLLDVDKQIRTPVD